MSKPKTTLSVATTSGFRRGQVLNVEGELLLLHRVLGATTLDIRPYRGWRCWRHKSAALVRRQWAAARDGVRGWFERDDEPEWGAE